jgi:hypothetical protein
MSVYKKQKCSEMKTCANNSLAKEIKTIGQSNLCHGDLSHDSMEEFIDPAESACESSWRSPS